MDQSPSRRHIKFLTAGLVVCVGLLGVAFWGLWNLSSKIDWLETDVNMAARDAAAASSATEAIRWRTDNLISRVEVLEQVTGAPSSSLKIPTAQQLDGLAPGLYVLLTSSQYDPKIEDTSPYTITHVVVEMQFKDYETTVQMGLASREALGMISVPIAVYFDYNKDGQVDTDMAMNFIRDIPVLGGRLAKAYDPVDSQNLYSIFVSEAESAGYTSVDDMAQDAEAATSYIWTFLMDQYDVIEEWVSETLQEQQPDE